MKNTIFKIRELLMSELIVETYGVDIVEQFNSLVEEVEELKTKNKKFNLKITIMRNELLDSINEIHKEMESLTRAGSCGEYVGCAEYTDTKYIVDSVLKSPIVGNLLFLFWQRTSDACPLECIEAEKQESDFKDWIRTIDFDSLIKTIDEKK